MPDVFILGAGFSKAISPVMPVLRELTHRVLQHVPIPEAKQAALSFTEDIELWLTYLSQTLPWMAEADRLRNKMLFEELTSAIRKVIIDGVSDTTARAVPSWLTELVRWWHQTRAVVVTFNYDTLVERALSEIQYDAAGRSFRLDMMNVYPPTLISASDRSHHGAHSNNPTPTFRYFKLHGSVNWFATRSPGIYYVGSSYWDERETPELNDTAPVADKKPLIVPPVLDKYKHFKHDTIQSLWADAGAALRQAGRIFCLGYSLPETDLTVRFFLQRCQPHGTHEVKWHLIDRDPGLRDHFRKLLPARYEIDNTFVGTGESIARFVAAIPGL